MIIACTLHDLTSIALVAFVGGVLTSGCVLMCIGVARNKRRG